MSLHNTPTAYGSLARTLHWSMAVLMIGLIALGLYMTEQPDGDPKWALYDLHKSFGVIAFALLLMRIVWRHVSPPPPLPAHMPPLERAAAHIGHGLLYLTMIALPVSGYLDSAWGGYHISVFGTFDIPMLLEKNKALFEIAEEVHEFFGNLLILLVLGHAAAALKHHFVQKDDVLTRMLRG